MENKKAKWEISCDGYYPYCSECGYEPYEFTRAHNGKLPNICPNCGAQMADSDKRFEKDNYIDVASDKKCFAIDFDGTLVIGDNYPTIGEPNWPVINKVKELKKYGHEICLWTCRGGNDLQAALNFCKEELDLTFDAVMTNTNALAQKFNVAPCKLAADYYVDDRALNIADFLTKKDFMLGKSVATKMTENQNENPDRI